MLRRILVPLDGSRIAEAAVPVAVRLASLADATMRFVLVRELGLSQVPTPEAVLVPAEERLPTEASYLADVVGRCIRDDVEIGTCVTDGVAAPALAKQIGQWPPDLVVMVTHGRGPLKRLLLGSVADYLIRHVAVPLLLLKAQDEADWPTHGGSFDSILVPLDLSATGQAILRPMAELASLTAATIELVHVVQPLVGIPAPGFGGPGPSDPGFEDRERRRAQSGLDRVAASLRHQGLVVKTTVVFGASVSEAILKAADQGGHDLVALATHGAGGVKRALVGSVADQVIRRSKKPVLVVRPV